MPRGDRTGPMGMGPMTGRGAGYCAGNSVPGCMDEAMSRRGGGFGRGRGRGFGWGRGWRQGYGFQAVPYAMQPYPVPLTNERSALKNQAKHLEEALKSINSRITEIDSETT